MKKALKITFFVAVVLSVLALFVCKFVIPNETKNFIENAVYIFNQPLPIVGFSLVTLCGVILTILSKTSWGKKALEKLKSYVDKKLAEAEEHEANAKEYYEQGVALKEEAETYLAMADTSISGIIDTIVELCELSPNAKIKEFGGKVKAKFSQVKTPYVERVEEIKANVNDRLIKENTIAEMNSKIMGLEEVVNEMKGLGVQNGGEN